MDDNRLLRAEAAAERVYESIESEEEEEEEDILTPTRKKQMKVRYKKFTKGRHAVIEKRLTPRRKQMDIRYKKFTKGRHAVIEKRLTPRKKQMNERYKKFTKVKQAVIEKRRKESKQNQIKKLMDQYLGGDDVVEEINVGPRRNYIYKCQECNLFVKDKLNRHLQLVHKYNNADALRKQSELRVMYLWCRTEKHNCPLPLPCKDCNEWFLRLDHHLLHHKNHKTMTDEDRETCIVTARESSWKTGCKTNLELPSAGLNTGGAANNIGVACEEETFVRRSVPQEICAVSDMENYIPNSACRLTSELKCKWGVKNEDFFTIYYEDADALLKGFLESLLSAGMENNLAVQHKNHVELVWSTVSKKMTILPVHPLSNLHLLRDFYHYPTFQMIGKRDGVQASTLRSRYTSLGFFIQFLRKCQVFAGMSRMQLQVLEQAIGDFNKELNPLIKQRKVTIRGDKLKQLLLPSHFIKYGRSKAVQALLKVFSEFRTSPKSCKQKLTRKFAIQFRDYLLTNMVIGNGLRASNVMELRLVDFAEHKVVSGYEGHKVLSNDRYKTSTIYGEKFIVIPDELYEQYLFYVENLRGKISSVKSNKVFLAGERKKMSQSNVSSSLTASFMLGKVLEKSQYQRVSCTRIRCGIATFACNDGGYETAFFARHFMKNKEETTSLHYNLLSNRRHALNIAMKLYKSFSGVNGQKIDPDINDVDKLVTNFTSSINYDTNEVINWLVKHNPDLSKKELDDFKCILEERSKADFVSTADVFYGKDKVKRCTCLEL